MVLSSAVVSGVRAVKIVQILNNGFYLSKRVKAIRYKNRYFVFNSLLGNSGIIDKETFKFLKLFLKGKNRKELSRLNFKNINKWISYYRKEGFIFKEDEDENRKIFLKREKCLTQINSKLSGIGFCVTDFCNLNCVYCIKRKCDLLWHNFSGQNLNWHKAKLVIDSFFKNILKDRKILTIGFSGGEPLIKFDLIKKIVAYSKTKAGKNKKLIRFSITTNLILLTEESVKFFRKEKFLIGVSLDGLKASNDRTRIYKNNKGTFNDVMENIDLLLRYVPVKRITLSTTVSENNFRFLSIKFLKLVKNLGIKKVSLEVDSVNPLSFTPEKIVARIFKLYKFGEKNGITIDGYWKKPFKFLISGKIPVVSCSPMRGESFAVLSNGEIRPCVYAPKIDKIKATNIEDLYKNSAYRKLIEENLIGNIKKCKGCELEGVCLGGCYITRILPDQKIFKDKCKLYKIMTHKLIIDFMKENYKY